MKKIILLLLVLVLPSAASAEDPGLGRPHWSLEVKGGTFAPTIERWGEYYGKKNMPEYAVTLAYKILRQVEIGVGAGMARDKGLAHAPLHSEASGAAFLSGSVAHELYPFNVFVLARGIIYEDQWLVPYIGGGWTRMYYRQKIEDQGRVRGSADGYHMRGGLQLCLDILDQSAANNMLRDYGVYHTYLFVEAERTKAKLKSLSVDLGGTAYMLGLLFEF